MATELLAIRRDCARAPRRVKLLSVTNDLYGPVSTGTVRGCHRLAAAVAHYTRGCAEVLRRVLTLRLSGMTARRQAKTRSQPGYVPRACARTGGATAPAIPT